MIFVSGVGPRLEEISGPALARVHWAELPGPWFDLNVKESRRRATDTFLHPEHGQAPAVALLTAVPVIVAVAASWSCFTNLQGLRTVEGGARL